MAILDFKRIHQDERGTEAVEWIAIGASLFIAFAAMSLVYDSGGADAGDAVMRNVERTIGYWHGTGSRSSSAIPITQNQIRPQKNGQNSLRFQLANVQRLSTAQRAELHQRLSQLSAQELDTLGMTAAEVDHLLARRPEADGSADTTDSTDTAQANVGIGNTSGQFISAGPQVVAASAGSQRSTNSAEAVQMESALNKLLTSVRNRVKPIVDTINQTAASMLWRDDG